jgi:hypothetical protein
MSHGPLGGEIPGMAIGASRLAQELARSLFAEDAVGAGSGGGR